MNARHEPLLEGMHDVGSKSKAAGPWWAPRSLGRIMSLIALGGVAMAAYAQHARSVPRRFPVPPRFTQPPTPAVLRLAPPRDPGIVVAPRGIDDAMIVTARPGIDDAMIVNRGRWPGGLEWNPPAPEQPPARVWRLPPGPGRRTDP